MMWMFGVWEVTGTAWQPSQVPSNPNGIQQDTESQYLLHTFKDTRSECCHGFFVFCFFQVIASNYLLSVMDVLKHVPLAWAIRSLHGPLLPPPGEMGNCSFHVLRDTGMLVIYIIQIIRKTIYYA